MRTVWRWSLYLPPAKFKTNYAFFQIVMRAYNIWRYLKMIAQLSIANDKCAKTNYEAQRLQGIMNNTIRSARLKLLFIAAKVVKESNRHKVKYSIQDSRTPLMLNFLKFLDTKRLKPRPWEENSIWPQRFSLQTSWAKNFLHEENMQNLPYLNHMPFR